MTISVPYLPVLLPDRELNDPTSAVDPWGYHPPGQMDLIFGLMMLAAKLKLSWGVV